jgi:hypothetical protein
MKVCLHRLILVQGRKRQQHCRISADGLASLLAKAGGLISRPELFERMWAARITQEDFHACVGVCYEG